MNEAEIQYEKATEVLMKYNDRELIKLKHTYEEHSGSPIARQIIDNCQYMEEIKGFISNVFITRLQNTTDDTVEDSLKILKYFMVLGSSEKALNIWANYIVSNIFDYKHFSLREIKVGKGEIFNVFLKFSRVKPQFKKISNCRLMTLQKRLTL